MAIIKLPSGAVIKTNAGPSRNFNPLTADINTLKSYSLPLRPKPEHDEARFDEWVSAMSLGLEYVEPVIHIVKSTRKHRSNLVATSTNWSGCIITRGGGWDGIQGYWNVPSVLAPPGTTSSNCSIWIGVDGSNGSTDVFQTGIRCDVVNAAGTPEYYSWFEWFPDGEARIDNFTIAPGDNLYCVANTNDPTYGVILIQNRTTGKQTSATVTPPSGTKLMGNCAEWIVERPMINGSASTLPNYGSVQFDGAYARDGTDPIRPAMVNAGLGVVMNMTDNSGKTISTGTIIGNDSVRCIYTGP